MGKRWVKTDTEIICPFRIREKLRKDSYLRGSVSHRKFLLSHKPSKAIVFILIKHGVFDCKVHKQKRHVKGGSFRMVAFGWLLSYDLFIKNECKLVRCKPERVKEESLLAISAGGFLTLIKRGRLPTLPLDAVPSAWTGLTSLFGMGRGGTPSP